MLNIHGLVPFALPMTQENYACEMQVPNERTINLDRKRRFDSQSLRGKSVNGISGLDLLRYA